MSRFYSLFDFVRHHKYLVTFVVFVLFVGFIDGNSLWQRHYRWQSIADLKQQISDLKEDYKRDTRELNELNNNPHRVEQVARERYFMTRDGEDLFIIQRGDSLSGGEVVTGEGENEDEPQV